MKKTMFQIQSQHGAKPHPLWIPWSVAELAYSVYSGKYGRSQSLETLAERGGFGPGEMDEFLPDWRERCDEIMRLKVALDKLAGLQAHYAGLLNDFDGGQRHPFKSGQEWIDRLVETGDLLPVAQGE
jgi:hypothetical protein